MTCPRCGEDAELVAGAPWCEPCDLEYDKYVRSHASGIIVPVLTAMAILMTGGLIVPLLGGSTVFAAVSVFVGFGTMLGMVQGNKRRLRRRFQRAPLPQARLTSG